MIKHLTIKMHHITRHLSRKPNKLHRMMQEVRKNDIQITNNLAPPPVPIDSNEIIRSESQNMLVPSLSENDHGSLAYNNADWRKHKSWKIDYLPTISRNSRGLFGNLVRDDQTPMRKLNKYIFDSLGWKNHDHH
jgi:hypothetical protein